MTDAEVARHFPLVHFTLQRMARRAQLVGAVDYEDLEAVGRWALWEALRRWSPAKGTQSTYLSSYVWGYVMKAQRDMTKATGWHRTDGRLAFVESLDAALTDDGLALLDVISTQPAAESEALEHLRDVASRMPRARRVVAETMLDDRPLVAAADELGVSRQRVNQIAHSVRRELASEFAA